ncbi:T9SS type A sorting domain-containing protein [Chryseobacterium sp. WG23]|uniref:T9SS type A sorting domain-containing protein n=1 Tax=Chryseobacterium sp. WG23 TaxID=2926910 RepID=UPI00211E2A79|nr:T9SS type A sorting domain-containing protein [Chryseobacterium sp. WG23]MCQ9634812.1 T9SS type A sorting domain-containing protein [Chryseobacterium sp. WG23]
MKKLLLTLSMALANFAWAQFSSGVVSLGATGMTVKLETSPTLATLTLTGNSTSYLGIGAGDSGMEAGADGFIYNSSSNLDYSFNGIGAFPSVDAVQDWTLVSNTVSGTTRTVIATRSLSGSAGDFVIPNAAGSLDIFFARGGSTAISQHSSSNRGYATLTMTASNLSTSEAVTETKKVSLYPNPARQTVSFKNVDRIKSIDIYEAAGRKIKSVKPDKETISIEDLKSGIYYFEILLKDGSLSYEKLIKE